MHIILYTQGKRCQFFSLETERKEMTHQNTFLLVILELFEVWIMTKSPLLLKKTFWKVATLCLGIWQKLPCE